MSQCTQNPQNQEVLGKDKVPAFIGRGEKKKIKDKKNIVLL